MIKEILISFSALALLTACGGSSAVSDTISSLSDTDSDTDKLSKRDAVLIAYNYPSSVCSDPDLIKGLERDIDGTSNYLAVVESNNVTCSTYGKNSNNCSEEDYGGSGGKSCVIGFDVEGANKQLKSSVISEMEDVKNSMIISAD